MPSVKHKPHISNTEAEKIARSIYGLDASAIELTGERDQNFCLRINDLPRYVLKLSNLEEPRSVLEFQNAVLDRLASRLGGLEIPRPAPDVDGNRVSDVILSSGQSCLVRLLTYVNGRPLKSYRPLPLNIWETIGRHLGNLDRQLEEFSHPAAHRKFQWNLSDVTKIIIENSQFVKSVYRRHIIDHFTERYLSSVQPILKDFSSGIIHNDGHDDNFLAQATTVGQIKVVGLVDFGDMVYGPYAYEPSVAGAYSMVGTDDPLHALERVVRGYTRARALDVQEIDAIFYLACLRICTSVSLAAAQRILRPEDPYLSVSEEPGWQLLEKVVGIDPGYARRQLLMAAGLIGPERKSYSLGTILKKRRRFLGPSYSLAYREPLHIVRGFGQYLYDGHGRRYLDLVNNVAHVGHCHPRVVSAGQRQMALLNTNTRYLNENLNRYAQRLLDLFPDPLDICYFVCSGSEANELALRMATTISGRKDILVLDGAYHGNTNSLVGISPYKFNGPGGSGAHDHVHVVPIPDVLRADDSSPKQSSGGFFADFVGQKIEELQKRGRKPAAFIAESLMGCAGQIPFPRGYLKKAFQFVRNVGGLCIADEVQVGFGRIGSHYWGFESQEVVPDIVTLGKPMGNGHPLAAVITTRAIADSFANGMEYFNTFGGNPVSCAIGMAVLDVIEDESLQENASELGDYLKSGFTAVMEHHTLIGDVRGQGLFIGIELVKDRNSLEPAAEEATEVVERMKQAGFLLSTDGIFHNVIKLKPPLVLNKDDAHALLDEFEKAISSVE